MVLRYADDKKWIQNEMQRFKQGCGGHGKEEKSGDVILDEGGVLEIR